MGIAKYLRDELQQIFVYLNMCCIKKLVNVVPANRYMLTWLYPTFYTNEKL